MNINKYGKSNKRLIGFDFRSLIVIIPVRNTIIDSLNGRTGILVISGMGKLYHIFHTIADDPINGYILENHDYESEVNYLDLVSIIHWDDNDNHLPYLKPTAYEI